MPTPVSYEDTILSAALAVLQGITFATSGTLSLPSANVKRRMLPHVDESLNDGELPCVILAAGGPESEEIISFEGHKSVVYAVEVAVVAAANRDYATNEAVYEKWREQIKRAFGRAKIDGAPSVYDVRINPGPLFDRSLLNQQYVYGSITLRISSCEPRS